MSVNFCHEDLTTGISSDKTSFEGHEVENLISNNILRRQKGFLTSNFIRPPATVDFKFVCAVNISYIVIRCRVGAQKSTGFEIFTLTSPGERKNSVGCGHVNDTDNSIVFHIHGQSSRLPLGNMEANTTKCTFKSSRNLFKVVGVSIKIFRTQSSSVPALGQVEIWANPARSVPRSLTERVKTIWDKINNRNPVISEECNSETVTVKKLVLKDGFEIPEEFIDPISCEIMTIPMTLPCGKVVDITTLEKFHKEEEKWGRSKSDPFTGIFFTDHNKPVLAVALKTRLDKFMIDNCNKPLIKSLPRTVGKKTPMISNNYNGLTKKLKLSGEQASTSHSQSSVETTESNFVGTKPNSSKTSSLDDLLSSSLQGLPSYLEKPSIVLSKNQCLKCSALSTLFKLPCEHLLCRSCLVSMKSKNEQNCEKCNHHFKTSDPVRFHISNFDV